SSLLVRFTRAASGAVAALRTNSPSDSRLISVSFFVPSRRSVGEKTTTGGLAPKALKKLNGAKFTTPAGESVVTQAIGRGVTTPTSTWYTSTTFALATSIRMGNPGGKPHDAKKRLAAKKHKSHKKGLIRSQGSPGFVISLCL